jgi:hypothetical protein
MFTITYLKNYLRGREHWKRLRFHRVPFNSCITNIPQLLLMRLKLFGQLKVHLSRIFIWRKKLAIALFGLLKMKSVDIIWKLDLVFWIRETLPELERKSKSSFPKDSVKELQHLISDSKRGRYTFFIYKHNNYSWGQLKPGLPQIHLSYNYSFVYLLIYNGELC